MSPRFSPPRRPLNPPAPASISEPFAELRADYAAAKASRFRRVRRGTLPLGSGADFHTRIHTDYFKIVEDARDMDRNDSTVGQGISRAVTMTTQAGLMPDAQTPDKALNADLNEDFAAWANDPKQADVAHEHDFGAQQHLILRDRFVAGDIFPILVAGEKAGTGAVQVIENYRCKTPGGTKRNLVNGILLDDRRRRRQYWFAPDSINPYERTFLVGDMMKYDVNDDNGDRQVLHNYDPKRVTQTRGISALAPIFDLLGMCEDIQFAELVRRQVAACFAVIRNRAVGFPGASTGAYGEQQAETRPDGTKRLIEGISPGMEIEGVPGETITGFSPGIPGPDFIPHMRMVLMTVSANLGMPLNMFLLDATDTNFSSWRGTVDMARQGFRYNQILLRKQFVSPVYRFKLRDFIATNRAYRLASEKWGMKFFRHRVSLPAWPHPQPLEEANADDRRLQSRTASRRRIIGNAGADIDEIDRETVNDNKAAILMAINAAKEIEAETQVKVDWHELLYIPASNSTSVALSNQAATLANTKQEPASPTAPKGSPSDKESGDDSDDAGDEDTEGGGT